MFKKLYVKINCIYEKQDRANRDFNRLLDSFYDLSNVAKQALTSMTKKKSMETIILSQQRTIEQLTNALMNKYEHGLFVVSEDCKHPIVIRNGKEITGDRTTYFRITWAVGEAPTIETEQTVGTFVEEE